MSVNTKVDDLRADAKDKLKCVIVNINEMLQPDTWGNDDLAKSYKETLIDLYSDFMKAYLKL